MRGSYVVAGAGRRTPVVLAVGGRSRWRLGALRRNMRFTVRASVVPCAT